jgi:hypothetical protein
VLRVPSTLYSTLASVWLGSRMGLRSVRITRHVKQVQYVEPQEDHHLTPDVRMFAYIDVNLPKERSPVVWQIPSETLCICLCLCVFLYSRNNKKILKNERESLWISRR